MKTKMKPKTNDVKLGSLTNPRINIIKEIREVKNLGFDFVEIGIEGPEAMPEVLIKKKKQIRALLERFDAPPVAHTPWYANMGSLYKNVRAAWIKEGKKMIKTANIFGIEKLNFHLICANMPIPDEEVKTQILDNFVKSFKKLTFFGKKYKMKIMIENGIELGSFEDNNYVLKKVPNLGFHLDIGHGFVVGGMDLLKKFIIEYNERVEHIHASDNNGLEDQHLPVGRGNINYKKVISLLKHINYDKTITLEVFPDRKDAVKSMNKIKRMWR